ncbi:MAG: 50S ribosomal protein L13 [Planctomycetes bacterium]|nr:50S ribosomal protein L13 [Planctomycetota bacterium]
MSRREREDGKRGEFTPANFTRNWHLVDASDKVVGRLATKLAMILQGKNKPTYTPHIDTGDFVVVVNASKVHLTGKKWEQKFHRYHTGYVGNFRQISYEKLRESNPELVILQAVKRMLPKTTLGRSMLRKLKIYRDDTHPHAAQQPVPLEV